MEQVRNEPTIYSAAVYCKLSKDDEQVGEKHQYRNPEGESKRVISLG